MKDAYSGIMDVVFIAVFLVIISGILGFIIIYQRAFRVKNNVIATIEQYEGAMGCGLEPDYTQKDTQCIKRIKENAKTVGYTGDSNLNCPQGYNKHSSGIFCYKSDEMNEKDYYHIVVKLDIQIPIINRLGFSFFQVTGDTRTIERYKTK